MKNVKVLDLFAGAGGLSEGFTLAGFDVVSHVEMDHAACNTLKTRVAYHYLTSNDNLQAYHDYLTNKINRSQFYSLIPNHELCKVINLPIGAETNDRIFKLVEINNNQNIDIIIGGPPCQAYSLVGRARSKDGMMSDPRNYLYIEYGKYLKRYKPKVFVFENVLGLKSANSGLHLENMKDLFNSIGYSIKLFTLDAKNFGVLQNRKRIIIIGWLKNINYSIPDLESISCSNNYCVSNIFSDLPAISAGSGTDKHTCQYITDEINEYLLLSNIRQQNDILTQHIARPHNVQDLEIYRIAVTCWNNSKSRLNYNELPNELKTHNNKSSFTDRFKVVASDIAASQTIVAHISKDGHYYIHPDINQNRSITVREAARLQSFPDNYYFEGVKEKSSRTAAFKQIGNAVPPLMSYQIAKQIAKLF